MSPQCLWRRSGMVAYDPTSFGVFGAWTGDTRDDCRWGRGRRPPRVAARAGRAFAVRVAVPRFLPWRPAGALRSGLRLVAAADAARDLVAAARRLPDRRPHRRAGG